MGRYSPTRDWTISGDVDDPYSSNWLKQKLLEKYVSNISFTVKGREMWFI